MSDGLLVTPLRDAAASLQRALVQPKDEFMRDATIQRFESSFELAWKLLAGSRATGRSAPASDLDLLVDARRISEAFAARIRSECAPLPGDGDGG